MTPYEQFQRNQERLGAHLDLVSNMLNEPKQGDINALLQICENTRQLLPFLQQGTADHDYAVQFCLQNLPDYLDRLVMEVRCLQEERTRLRKTQVIVAFLTGGPFILLAGLLIECVLQGSLLSPGLLLLLTAGMAEACCYWFCTLRWRPFSLRPCLNQQKQVKTSGHALLDHVEELRLCMKKRSASLEYY